MKNSFSNSRWFFRVHGGSRRSISRQHTFSPWSEGQGWNSKKKTTEKNGRSKSWKDKLTKIRDLCHSCKIKVVAMVQKKHAFNNDHQVFSWQPKHPALAFSGPSLGTQSCPFVLTSSNSWEDSRCCRHSSARNLQPKSHVLMPCAAARCRSFKTRSWEASVSSNQVTYDWLFQTKTG